MMDKREKQAKVNRKKLGQLSAGPAAGPAAGFESAFEQVYQIVLRIPPGKVMTYGQISRQIDERLSAVAVGWALRATPAEREIPWHRVVNARGGISTDRLLSHAPNLQQRLLEAEGVVFNEQGQLDLTVYQLKT